MARSGYIDGVDDMLSDAERLDAEDGDDLNLIQKDMIEMLFRDLGFSIEEISDHLAIEVGMIQETLAFRGHAQGYSA